MLERGKGTLSLCFSFSFQVLDITKRDQKVCLKHGLCAIGLVQLHSADTLPR